MGEEIAQLTYAPQVPPPIARKHATHVKVHLETREITKRLSDGVEYSFWTFGGSVPGPMIRVREGDLVDFTLANHPSSKMPHNIDLHAVTGQGGGAAASLTAPGHSSQFSFKALNPGVYVYHCATAPVGMHVANGMYGLIVVEPKAGYPKVDKEFYIMQSEFYTEGKYGDPGVQPFSMEKAIQERADYVVFNGEVGALVGEKALRAKTGESIRLFVGNGGPNLLSSFHVIGEIFDHVYAEGGVLVSQKQVQTTLIPAGGSSVVDFKVEVPGTYILVDHSLTRAFNKGALGMLKVEGPENKLVYSGKKADAIYLPEGGDIQKVGSVSNTLPTTRTKEERMALGKNLFNQNCMACHMGEGQGVPQAFPPLAKSDFLMADRTRAIRTLLQGLSGKIKVNGSEFNGLMPRLELTDDKVANILTYITNSWGNSADVFNLSEIQAVRKSIDGNTKPVGEGE